MYATVEDVQGFVGLQFTEARIKTLLEFTEGDITSIVGDIKFGIKYEDFGNCRVYDGSLYFKNIQVKKILEVNGKEFIDEYTIMKPQNRRVWLDNLSSYIDNNKPTFTVKYTSGYEKIPADIRMAQALIVSYMLTSGGPDKLVKYKMGPRTLEYDASLSSPYLDKAASILNRYRIFSV